MNAGRSIIFRIILLPCLVTVTYQPAAPHAQHVHQYVVREAYLLLKASLGRDIPRLQDHVGGLEPYFAGDSAWQRPYLTTGAWREDEEDVIFAYDSYQISPGLNYALVSITHFWDADQGDLTSNMFRLRLERSPLPPLDVDIGPYENAYDKFVRFAQGGWILWFPRTLTAENLSDGHHLTITPAPLPAGYGVPLSYDRLTQFTAGGVCTLRPSEASAFVVFDDTDKRVLDSRSVHAIRVGDDVIDAIVWETLGRMCHLLADMGVPAHTHRDEHGLNPDSYENFMGGAAHPYTSWDHQNAGSVIDPHTPDNEPLHFLMYVMQQLSDHFGSDGPADGDGNDQITGNPRQHELEFVQAMNTPLFGGPTTEAGPWDVSTLSNIRDRTLPVLIRATAGLLYWFSRETGLISTSSTQMAPMIPVHAVLFQNYPNPFNPTTIIRYQIPHAGWVRLAVYDMLGREVARLVDEQRDQGSYDVTIDGRAMASGVYVYQLTAGPFVRCRTMTLVR